MVIHSQTLIRSSFDWSRGSIIRSLPIHLAQKKSVGPLPKARRTAEERMAIHQGAKGHGLADEHAEGGEEHPRQADDHHGGHWASGHDQDVHVLDIPAADLVFDVPTQRKSRALATAWNRSGGWPTRPLRRSPRRRT